MSSRRRLARALTPAAVLLASCGLAPQVLGEDDGPYASGALAWILSDRLDLIGSMAADVPFAEAGGWRIFLGVRAMTAIEAASDFTFQVDEVSYAADFGARRRLGSGRGAVSVFAGEQGRQSVDAVGRARVRAAGASWESDSFRRAFGPDGWEGGASLGVVFEHHGVDAIATTEGGVRWMRHVGRTNSVSAGVDLTWDGLLGHDHGFDLLAGPRLDFDLGGDRRFGLYARWLSGGNPLGFETDGLLLGFDFSQGPKGPGARTVPPEIVGFVAAGAGDGGRGLARLDVRVQTPPFLRGTYGEIEVNGNVLTASDQNDLFYLYDVGIVHPVATDWRVGAWFFHRSNHVLGDANPTVTSINVVQAGIESVGWNRPEPSVPLGRAGALDLVARAGWVADSTLGGDDDWQVTGGVRYAPPPWGSVRFYATVEAERGNAEGSSYAIGMLLRRGFDVRIASCHDEELFSSDQRALLGIATLRF